MSRQDPIWIEIFNGTTGTGTPIPCGDSYQLEIEYDWATGVTAGVVVLEESSDSAYAGLWSNLDTQDVTAGGYPARPCKLRFKWPVPQGFVRARITTNVSGGASPNLIVKARRLWLE